MGTGIFTQRRAESFNRYSAGGLDPAWLVNGIERGPLVRAFEPSGGGKEEAARPVKLNTRSLGSPLGQYGIQAAGGVVAGRGGGRRHAAATIQALAASRDTGWSRSEMAQLGQEVGSDVPCFFYRATALVEGRGEQVTPLQLEAGRWLLLVNPGVAIST